MRRATSIAIFAILAALSPTRRAAAALRPEGAVDAIACAPTNSLVAAAIVRDTVWITRDGGARWEAKSDLSNLSGQSEWAKESVQSVESVQSEESEQSDEPEQSDEIEEPGDTLLLAVGDGGEWAVSRGSLWVVEFGKGTHRFNAHGAIAGLAFDASARLWIASANRLEVHQRGCAPRDFAIARAGWPAPGRDGAVLVPGARGVFEARLLESGAISARVVGRPADAVAIEPASGISYSSSSSAIFRRIGDGARAVARAPRNVRRLWAAGDRFWALSDGGWYSVTAEEGARRLPWRAIAVDALGRLWRGSESGPIPPRESLVPTRGREPAGIDIRVELVPSPASPCARWFSQLLPDAKLALGLGLGSIDSRDTNDPLARSGRSSSISFGVAFTWNLGPTEDVSCAARRERFYEREEERLDRLIELRYRLATASAEAVLATTVEAALEAMTEVETASARIAAAGGRIVNQREEEQR